MRHTYQPQHDEPPEIPIDNVQIASNRRAEAQKKLSETTTKLIFCITLLNLLLLSPPLHYVNKLTSSVHQILARKLGPLHYMSANLEALPIMDIQLVDYGSACPSDFQPLKLGTWPGTVAGCLCDNGDLHRTSCGLLNSEKCKTDVSSTYPFDMYEWEDSSFCVKRAVLGTDYLRQTECPQGYKECYPGGCFKGDCPVTHLEITLKETSNKFNGHEKFLTLTKAQGEFPLINVQITLGDIPCFTQDLFAQSIRNSSYTLSSIQQNTCDQYGLNSQFSTPLDSQTALESFTQNSFPDFTMRLPHFEENANSTTSILSSMTRMKTANHDFCLSLNIQSIIKSLHIWLNGLENPLLLLFSAAIFLVQFYNIPMSALEICLSSHGDGLSLKLFFLPQSYLCAALPLILSIWYFVIYGPFKKMKEETERYISLKCFEGGQGSLVISDFLEDIRYFDNISWAQLGVVLYGVLFVLVSIWYLKKKKRVENI